MSKIEEVAARLWKADSEDAGVPASIAKGRTLEAFRDQSDETRARWFKFARAAIEAMREPTLEMMEDGDRSYRATATSGISGMTIEAQIRSKCVRFGEGWRAAIDVALSEEGR